MRVVHNSKLAPYGLSSICDCELEVTADPDIASIADNYAPPSINYCHSERSEESHLQQILRCAQNDRLCFIINQKRNNPVLAGRYLLVRNDREAACYELRVE